MKLYTRRFSFVNNLMYVVIILLAGCSVNSENKEKNAVNSVEWTFSPSSVIINLDAASELNSGDGQSHTLILGVIQMSNTETFYQLLPSPVSLTSLLSNSDVNFKFLQFKRYIISPGLKTTLVLDRIQNTRYIGIVVGYPQLSETNAVRLFNIPLKLSSSGFIFRDVSAMPAPLVVNLKLGEFSILNSQDLSNSALNESKYTSGNNTSQLIELSD